MSYQVTIEHHDGPITVEVGETILAAALRQGVAYPHGCQSGNCGACKSRLISGDVEIAPYSPFALTPEEREEELLLACRSVPWGDVTVAWIEQDEAVVHALRHLDCRVAAIDDLTHDIKRVCLEIAAGGPFDFTAGQFARVTFADCPMRDYSMASRPGDAHIEFHIRYIEGGATSTHVAGKLRAGDAVRVEGPYGVSYLRRQHSGPIVAVAGGSGMAPIASILGEALDAGMSQPMHLFFGVRDERDVYGEALLKELAAQHRNFSCTIVLSAPTAPTKRRTGLVHEAILGQITNFEGCKAYLAGPPPMVDAVTSLLFTFGMERPNIHADPFFTEAERAAQDVVA